MCVCVRACVRSILLTPTELEKRSTQTTPILLPPFQCCYTPSYPLYEIGVAIIPFIHLRVVREGGFYQAQRILVGPEHHLHQCRSYLDVLRKTHDEARGKEEHIQITVITPTVVKRLFVKCCQKMAIQYENNSQGAQPSHRPVRMFLHPAFHIALKD